MIETIQNIQPYIWNYQRENLSVFIYLFTQIFFIFSTSFLIIL